MTHDDTPIETSEADARPWRGEVPQAPAEAAQPIVGWHIRMRGCDGSADWIELGPERPTDVPDEADVLAVVHAEASEPAAQPATAPAPARWYCLSRIGMATLCLDEADAKRTAVCEDDMHPLNGPHRAVRMVEVASQPATAPVVPAGPLTIERLRADFESVKRMGLHRPRFSTKEVGALFAEIDRLAAAPAAPVVQPLTDEQIVRAAVAAMPATSPLVADDLLEGHTMHTEMEDIVAIWKAAGDTKAAPVVPQPAAQQGEAVAWMELADEYARLAATAHVESLYGTSKSYTRECTRHANEARTALHNALSAPPARQAVALTDERPTRADLVAALKFYANREHLIWSDESAWDTVSGEPQNWWCDEAGTATVEDGTIAARTLAGELTAHDIEEIDEGDELPGITPA